MINAEHAAFFLFRIGHQLLCFVLTADWDYDKGNLIFQGKCNCSISKCRGVVVVFGTCLSCHRDFCGCGSGKQARTV